MVGMMYWFIYLRDVRKVEMVVELEPAPIPRPLVLLPEGNVMNPKTTQPRATQLYSFTVASADMFYSEVNRRELYIRDDPEDGFQVWGEIPGGGGVTAADLSEVLLEYAMTCAALGDLPQAYRQMDKFGRELGERLAVCVMRCTPDQPEEHRAACALECVLESLNAGFTIQQSGDLLSYTLDHCPLCDHAERTGLSQVELAHHGLGALCHSLIRSLDPELEVGLPASPEATPIFSLMTHEEVEGPRD